MRHRLPRVLLAALLATGIFTAAAGTADAATAPKMHRHPATLTHHDGTSWAHLV